MKRYWYFRAASVLSADDAETGDSIMVPVENITGMQQETDTTLDVFFKGAMNPEGGNGVGGSTINDYVTLTVTSGKRRAVMQALAEATNNGPFDEGITVIADVATSTYLIPEIEGITAVTIHTAV